MSWYELNRLGCVIRPLAEPRPRPGNVRAQFSAPLGRTVKLLGRELRQLDATSIVVELDLRDRDIRQDGFPRADARTMSPGVAVSFEIPLIGATRFETCEFKDWTDNLRGISLGLEALRAINRYGISKRGEQYRGWRELTAGAVDPISLIVTREDAIDVLADVLQLSDGALAFATGDDLVQAVKRAQRKTHPDAGGDGETFRKVTKAKEILLGG